MQSFKAKTIHTIGVVCVLSEKKKHDSSREEYRILAWPHENRRLDRNNPDDFEFLTQVAELVDRWDGYTRV